MGLGPFAKKLHWVRRCNNAETTMKLPTLRTLQCCGPKLKSIEVANEGSEHHARTRIVSASSVSPKGNSIGSGKRGRHKFWTRQEGFREGTTPDESSASQKQRKRK
jgi:hypothetical protein